MTIHLLRPSQLVRQCARASATLLATPLPAARGRHQLIGAVVRRTASNATATGQPNGVVPRLSLYGRYQALLQRRPFLVQAVQASVLMGAGDLIAQTCLEGRIASLQDVDYVRTLRFCVLGLVFVVSIRYDYLAIASYSTILS